MFLPLSHCLDNNQQQDFGTGYSGGSVAVAALADKSPVTASAAAFTHGHSAHERPTRQESRNPEPATRDGLTLSAFRALTPETGSHRASGMLSRGAKRAP